MSTNESISTWLDREISQMIGDDETWCIVHRQGLARCPDLALAVGPGGAISIEDLREALLDDMTSRPIDWFGINPDSDEAIDYDISEPIGQFLSDYVVGGNRYRERGWQ